jgi:hypothetical protein
LGEDAFGAAFAAGGFLPAAGIAFPRGAGFALPAFLAFWGATGFATFLAATFLTATFFLVVVFLIGAMTTFDMLLILSFPTE